MLFHVKMTVKLPPDMAPDVAAKLKADERNWRSACSSKAPGGTYGALLGTMPTTACSMCPVLKHCMTR